KTFNVIDMAKDLCDHLEVRWRQILQSSHDELINEYCGHLFKKNEQVTFKASNEIFTAVVRGVNSKGELLLEKNESIQPYSSIEWLSS
ncbi:MAG: biotin--[acetyl-CoA-carboxylase] ligase, partial [Segetibacter sp.]